MDLKKLAEAVPDYSVFLTVEELAASTRQLAADFPELVKVHEIGHSLNRIPLEMITIGSGPKSALIVGTPHPNEPIGTMTIEFLTRHLCENDALREELGYTWHFIKTIDPDGLKRNEGWLKGPFTFQNYLTHFFREALADQAEYSFPGQYKFFQFDKPTPQTAAYMAVLEEVKPDFLYSLHNAELGGVFYFISEDAPPLYEIFSELPGWFGLALDPIGEVGLSDKTYAPSISPLLSIKGMVDELEAGGATDLSAAWRAGLSSYEYAQRYGTFALVVEMPYWNNQQFLDESPTNRTFHEVLEGLLRADEEYVAWLQPRYEAAAALLEPGLNLYYNGVEEQLRVITKRVAATKQTLAKPDEDRPATHADVFANEKSAPLYRQRSLTMFKRMLEEELAKGNNQPKFVEMQAEAAVRLDATCKWLEKTIEYKNIPIRSLAAVQACAGLATAAYVRDRA